MNFIEFIEFIYLMLGLVFPTSLISFIFFIPALLLVTFIKYFFKNKFAIFLNFIFFEIYGYAIFIALGEQSQVQYFIISIPLTILFLCIHYLFDKHDELNSNIKIK